MRPAERSEHPAQSAATPPRGSGLDALLVGVVLVTATGFRYLSERQLAERSALTSGDLAVTLQVVLTPLFLATMIVASRGERLRRLWGHSGAGGRRVPVTTLAARAAIALGAACILLLLDRAGFSCPAVPEGLLTAGTLPTGVVTAGVLGVFMAAAEELLRRGFLLNEMAAIFGHQPGSWAAAAGLLALAQTVAHAPAGLSHAVAAGLADLVLAAAYLGAGRSLWGPLLARGVTAV